MRATAAVLGPSVVALTACTRGDEPTDTWKLESPDGSLAITLVLDDGALVYGVSRHGELGDIGELQGASVFSDDGDAGLRVGIVPDRERLLRSTMPPLGGFVVEVRR